MIMADEFDVFANNKPAASGNKDAESSSAAMSISPAAPILHSR